MCGRFTYKYSWREIWELYNLTLHGRDSNFPPRFNVCPTTTINAVIPQNEQRQLMPMRWGLIPAWWSKPLKEMKMATFNARAETVATKPMFRSAFRKSRCLIPASGYYEWHDTPEGKQPYYFTRRDRQVMTIAGICDEWQDPESKQILKSCAMVITEPNDLVAEVHDRMPVILEQRDFYQWDHGKPEDAAELMRPAPEEILLKWPVSKRVNSSRADDGDETLIEKILI